MRLIIFLLSFMSGIVLLAQKPFSHDLKTEQFPWTDKTFDNNPRSFQFAIVSDRTGGHRAGVFGDALTKLNRLHPEFVMSVGDLIEGYTKDREILDKQWAEFDSILQHLSIRFFALPGNHDISNDVMRDLWLDRYGQSYYHFRYKDVLFLALDTNDGEGVMLSNEQVEYFRSALKENEDVSWTLLFMHHPIWNFSDFNGFGKIEALLIDRPYTVFAGHTHRYFKTVRQDRNYYVLSTTGGGSRLRGPRVGEFDHVTWVTMTEQGPDLIHLQLQGLIAEDVLSDENAPLVRVLNQAAQIEHLSLQGNGTPDRILLRMANRQADNYRQESSGLFRSSENSAPKPTLSKDLIFEGRFYHHHHLTPSPHTFSLRVPADSIAEIPIEVTRLSGVPPEDIDDLELDYTVRFEGPEFEPAYTLSGVKKIDFSYPATGLTLTEMDVFLDKHTVTMTKAFPKALIRFTLDGTEPNADSPIYKNPIQIDETTTVKAKYFSPDNRTNSSTLTKEYRKVAPLPAIALKDKKLKKGMRYAYYEGDFSESVPDFKSLKPVDEGIALDSDPKLIAEKNNMRKDHFAINFTGYIDIPADGVYTFYTYSDDGSILYLHDREIVNNDGSHSARLRSGYVALRKGWAPIRIGYFDDFLGETLRLGMIGPDGQRKEISFSELWHEAK